MPPQCQIFSHTSPLPPRNTSSPFPQTAGNAPRCAQPRRWTEGEDEELRQAVAEMGESNWKDIAARVNGRNHVQCLQRWAKVLKPGLKKGVWTPEEDARLMELVAQGYKNWGQLSNHLPGRTSKQCRERWCHHLDPSINKATWSVEEDRVIEMMQAKIGNKWSQIALSLPGRTENAIKIRAKSLSRTRGSGGCGGGGGGGGGGGCSSTVLPIAAVGGGVVAAPAVASGTRSRNAPDDRLRALAAQASSLAMARARSSGRAPTVGVGMPQDPAVIEQLVAECGADHSLTEALAALEEEPPKPLMVGRQAGGGGGGGGGGGSGSGAGSGSAGHGGGGSDDEDDDGASDDGGSKDDDAELNP
ncbi:unnamed protein product, partial [Phaeothamnion confervicola]